MTADPLDFAALLRRRRREAGLTQADLARRAGLAVRTLREVERGRTARVQRNTAVLLADALELAGPARDEFLMAARGVPGGAVPKVPRLRAAAARGASLPPVPVMIGREAELARLAEAVSELAGPAAPLSLVGVAGVGKSALALALAHRVADRFCGGVARVTVGPEADPGELRELVVAALGGSDPGAPARDLVDGPALLVVDTEEDAPAVVRALLAWLPPPVRVVTTSRGPLALPDEEVWPVSPLALPPAETEVDLPVVAGYPATALFLDRLSRVRAESPLLSTEEVPALVGLVRRLGGLPLALELAAAHGRLLRVPQILQRYGDRVLDLADGTGRTLREAIAGSYRLLDSTEQRALRRLAAFRERWSVELAEQLLAEQPDGLCADPVPLLDRLVSLGLVGVGTGGSALAAVRAGTENRFRMLDVVRAFATEQAERLGELGTARRAHATVVARLVDRVAPQLVGSGLPAAAARLDDLSAEVWSALSFAANDDPRTALWLASKLPRWWRYRGRDVAGRGWLRRLLADPRTAGVAPVVRAWAQLGLAQLAHEHGAGAAERDAAEAALAEFQRAGDVTGVLASRGVLAVVSWAQGRYEQAREHTEAALLLATREGRMRDAAVAQHNLVRHEIRVGDLAAARRRLASVDRQSAQSGEQRLRVLAAANLAEVARLEGRYDEAVAIGSRVLARLAEVGDPGHRRQVLGTLGQAFAASGKLAQAERALAALRSDHGGVPESSASVVAGLCAAIEARLAAARGDQVVAVEWFAAAAAAFREGNDPREVVEALVHQAACTAEPAARQRVLAELAATTGPGGFTLLPMERALLDGSG